MSRTRVFKKFGRKKSNGVYVFSPENSDVQFKIEKKSLEITQSPDGALEKLKKWLHTNAQTHTSVTREKLKLLKIDNNELGPVCSFQMGPASFFQTASLAN